MEEAEEEEEEEEGKKSYPLFSFALFSLCTSYTLIGNGGEGEGEGEGARVGLGEEKLYCCTTGSTVRFPPGAPF